MSNAENLARYKQGLKNQPIFNPEIAALVSEGLAILESEDAHVPPSKSIEAHSSGEPVNPYLRARTEIMNKFPKWRREEVLKMEASGNTNNRHYTEFVAQVMELGNEYSH